MALCPESSKDEPTQLGLTPVFYPLCSSLYQIISHQFTVLTWRKVKQDGQIQPSLWMQPGMLYSEFCLWQIPQETGLSSPRSGETP